MGLNEARSGYEPSRVSATETDILALSEELRQLVDASEERGTLLQSELNDVLEPLGLDALEIDAVHRELETRQIELVNDLERRRPPLSPPRSRRRRSRSRGRRRPTPCSCSCARPAGIRS